MKSAEERHMALTMVTITAYTVFQLKLVVSVSMHLLYMLTKLIHCDGLQTIIH